VGTTRVSILPRPALGDRPQKVSDDFGARLGAEIAFAVNADTDSVGFHVAVSDDEHGVDFHLLGVAIFVFMWSLLESSSQRT
jgi:hypothetical protein